MPNKNTRLQKRHSPSPSRHSRTEGAQSPSASFAHHMLKSIGISCLTAILTVFLASLAAYFAEDPAQLFLPLGLAAAAITAFVGGFGAVRLHKKSALLCGMTNACAMMALMLLLSLAFGNGASGHSTLLSCILHIAFLLLSLLGAYIALPRISHQKHRRIHTRR